jgi:hypothetical protein
MWFLLPQHVSGTNMPIIRGTISEYLPLLCDHTWNAAWVVLHWASWSDILKLTNSMGKLCFAGEHSV